ncbi:hypothetical protein [uncultured Corynebacterium sp.]|uniref:hypothetical protein n=1 Tax=uncultured Corynebacterium sp. TaxID=159447 RepID=UPI0025F83832|nr:hypothetical protein [uncultured Corynebacterium sp.]
MELHFRPSQPTKDTSIAVEIHEIFDHMLGDQYSVIDPATKIWTASAAAQLYDRIMGNPLDGKDMGQWDKLDIQLTGAPRDVVLLTAEIIFLREHPLINATPSTRKQHIERVLKHLPEPQSIPASMLTWLSRPTQMAGLNAGPWFNPEMWRHVSWVAEFIQHWARIDEEAKSAALKDPWRLQEEMLRFGTDRKDMRNLLQFLIRPDVFEPISSAGMKLRIRNAGPDPC